jgi:hypothetical protein
MLARAAADGTEVILEGSGGDELFGHDPWLIADRLLRGNIPGAVRLARTMPGVYRDWRTTLRALRLFGLRGAAPPWYHAARAARRARSGSPGTRLLRPRLEALLAEGPGPWEWKNASGPRWWRHLAHLLFVNAHELGVLDYLRRRGSLAGVRSGQPFMSPELADMILRLPPDLAFDREHNRPLLRAAVGELIPPSVANRTDKARFNPVFNEVLERDFGEIRRLLEPRSARISEWVEPGAVDDLLRDRPAGGMQLNRWSRQVWRLLGAECWLRAEEDPGFLARYR